MSRKHRGILSIALFSRLSLLFVVLELFHDPTSCGKLIVIQMIHAMDMQMNFVQQNAIDYCCKVIDQFCISL